MADQASLFSDADKQTETKQTTTTNSDTIEESVALLVGEGRKYKTVEELAKAYIAADEFVETLKGENATLREEVKKGATLDQVMQRLTKDTSQTTSDKGGTKPEVSGLSAADVASIVRNTLTGMETQRTITNNLVKADALMRQAFGDKAKEVFQEAATTPELKKALVDLAGASPEKFVAVFGKPTVASGTQIDSKTNVNSAALNVEMNSGRAADPGCKEYYSQLRRKEPAKYYSHAVQLQMNNAAIADPAKFHNKK